MQLTKHWAATLDDYVIDLGWSPDGAILAAASGAGSIQLHAATDGTKRHTLSGHADGTNCLAWQPAGRVIPNAPGLIEDNERRIKDNPPHLLASGGQDGCVKFWSPETGAETGSVAIDSGWVEHLAWRTQGEPLLFAAAGKKLRALGADGSIAHAFKDAPKSISALAAQPAGGCVAAAYFGGVCLWDADDFVVQKEFPYANGIQALTWSPDSRWLVSGNQDPSVHLWIPSEDIELNMSGYEGKVKELSYDRSSRWLATGGGRDCCVWDCSGAGPEGREPLMLPHDAKVCAVAFQHRHGLLATAAQDGSVMLWSPERPQPLRATVRMPGAAAKLAWSPDDSLLAIGSVQGPLYVLKCEA